MKDKKMFLIEEGFANQVLDYLTTRPFREVALFVQGFQMLQSSDVLGAKTISLVQKDPSLEEDFLNKEEN